MAFCGLFTFAQDNSFEDEPTANLNLNGNTNTSSGDSSSSTMGVSAGVRFSVLGLEPELSFIYSNFEAAVFAPMVEGTSYATDKDTFGPGIGTSIGYITDPFERGWENCVGLSYLFLSEKYMEVSLTGKVFNDNGHDNFLPNLHLFSIFYRGTVKFSKLFGISFRAELPLFVGASNGNHATIIGNDTWVCWLILPFSASLGLRFEIPF